jgi:hypothetical protein
MESTALAFPFHWIGALVAAVFLWIVMVIFGILLKIANQAATEVRESILPGVVAGIRDWTHHQGPPTIPITSGPDWDGGSSPDEAPTDASFPLEPVRRAR